MKTWLAKDYNFDVPEIRGSRLGIKFPSLYQIKYDGELNFASCNQGNVELFNKPCYGRHRNDMPATEELGKLNLNDTLIVGELIAGEGKDVYQFLRSKLKSSLRFACWDIIRHNGLDLSDKPVQERLAILGAILTQNGQNHAFMAEFGYIQSPAELKQKFNEIVSCGFEGLVVKNLGSRYPRGVTSQWCKVKSKCTADLAVLGYQKKAKYLSVLLGIYSDGKFIEVCHCGGGFKFQEKLKYAALLRGQVIREDRSNCYVAPNLVFEIEHLGVITDEAGNMTSLRNPVFKRIRTDKTVRETNIEEDKYITFG